MTTGWTSAPAHRAPRLDAAGVALLIPADGGTQVVVLLADPVAPPRIDLVSARGTLSFSRIRRGPIAHGLVELYSETETAELGARTLPVSDLTHETVWLTDAGRLFGSGDIPVAVPVGRGEAWVELGIPWGAIGSARRVVLRRGTGARDATFELAEEVLDDGWVCRVCGYLSPNPEPHTSAHGVPGHVRAGIRPGERLDETSSYSLP